MTYLVIICYILFILSCYNTTAEDVRCTQQERKVLLELKNNIVVDRGGLLASWGNQEDNKDCCKWKGVHCTSYINSSVIIKIDLHGFDASSPYPCLEGKLTPTLTELKHLSYLDLSYNNFLGEPIPNSIGSLGKLRYLDLSHAGFGGGIPCQLRHLSKLETLFISSNSLEGTLSNDHFQNFSRLEDLDLSNNSKLTLNFSVDWIPPFQLDTLNLRSLALGPHFPKWILTQTSFSYLDISEARISEPIPTSFWNLLTLNLSFLNMSNNNITGKLPNLSHPIFDHWRPLEVDLSFNSFEGTIPSFLGNVSSLKLNNNKFSNPIPLLCPKSKIVLLDLDLSNNLSSGELPDDCWENMDELSYLNLESNQFSGKLPQSIGAIKQLQSFRLCDNTFSGVLPISLWNCSSLVILDIGDNQFSGIIPPEIGNLRSLVDLNLRKNRLVGKIPSTLFTLSSLQILDLSGNRLTGTIPKSIYNLTGMSNKTIFLPNSTIISSHKSFTKYPHYAAWVKWKRVQQKFGNLLGLVKSFDVSNNNLQGEIPSEISYLGGLVSLDLSRNKFSGTITSNIGQLTSLEFLDLSNNRFCGEIPMSFVNLSYLGILDLSNNNLSGRIPLGTQLRGFDASYYMGNPGLCGEPLPKTCPGDEAFNKSRDGEDIELTRQDKDDEEGVFSLGLYISVVLGFIFGFWGVYGTLVLKTSWRQAYFRCVDSIKDRFYVIIAVNLARVSKA